MRRPTAKPQTTGFDHGLAIRKPVLSLSSARLNAATVYVVDRLPRKSAAIFRLGAWPRGCRAPKFFPYRLNRRFRIEIGWRRVPEFPQPKIIHRRFKLLPGVHHEWPVACNGFIYR